MLKRKIESISKTSSQILKNKNIWKPLQKLNDKFIMHNDNDYISGTAIKNYLLKDPMLDWLDLYYLKNGISEKNTRTNIKKRKTSVERETHFLNILFKNGNEFEDKVMDYLQIKYKDDIITINKEGRSGYTRENYDKTIYNMNMGIPIISQAVLFNDKNRTCGIADLIVRSDYINKLFDKSVLSKEEEFINAPNLKGKYHYRVIDIKWTTMTLCANGKNIRNDGRFPAYKGQLAIYNCAIGEIQGYTPNISYILAKAWKIDSKVSPDEGYNCFELAGLIDYNDFDKQYIEKTNDAIGWIRNVRKNGSNWSPLKPEIAEMYPNASNKNDAPWTKIKKNICDEIGEITQIWYVSESHRKKAHEKGIMSWKDDRCTSESLEISGCIRPSIIDAIMKVNRSKNIISPKNIKSREFLWNIEFPNDFYVDFETINKCFTELEMNIIDSKSDTDQIFMIGVGHSENGIWQYKCFIAEDLTKQSEYKIIDAFTKYIKDKSLELNPTKEYIPRLFHWTNAEITNFKHAIHRHNSWKEFEYLIQWTDMYKIFTSEPIVINGSLNFKLKDIAKAMHKHKLIKTCWNDTIKDGLGAMVCAVDYYNGKNNTIMKNIEDYNEVDCKVIYEIVDYLRKNNI